MTKLFQIMGFLSGLIPLVIVLIQQFETPGFGPAKKKAILDVVGSIYDTLGISVISKEKVIGIAGAAIDIVVAFFNAIGWFKHGSDPT